MRQPVLYSICEQFAIVLQYKCAICLWQAGAGTAAYVYKSPAKTINKPCHTTGTLYVSFLQFFYRVIGRPRGKRHECKGWVLRAG